jgi:hypothetical protein
MAQLLSSDKPGQSSDMDAASGRTRTLPKGRVSECPKPRNAAGPRIIVVGCTVTILASNYAELDA